MELEGRKVLVVGLARTGVAAARFLALRKARVTCTDLKGADEMGEAAGALEATGCRLRLGGHEAEDFREADLIVVSPGVPLTIPPLRDARAAGVEIIGEVELAFRHMSSPIIGVTGTNGKTTTVHLIDAMLEAGGVPHWVGGNIGKPLTEFLLQPGFGRGGSEPVVVAELSSFQLETIVHFRPWIAVWTNLSADHLDRYPSMEAYAEAKARIFQGQTGRDFAVLPAREPWLERRAGGIRSRLLRFGLASDPDPEVCLEEEGVILYRHPLTGREERYETGGVRVPGRHNLENMMCALAAARLCGADPGGVQRAMEDFPGLEHRVEFVAEAGGIRFYNDSKATTVDSVVRALDCFGEPVLLLAGGKDKGGSYAPLRESLLRHVRRLILYGAAAGRMERELRGSTAIERAVDLEEALSRAWRAGRPGDVILLSPACSSFDMFRDYEERGLRFKTLVRRLVQGKDPAG